MDGLRDGVLRNLLLSGRFALMSVAHPPTSYVDSTSIPSEPPRQILKEELGPEQKAEIKTLHTQSGSSMLRQQGNNLIMFALLALNVVLWQQGMYPLLVASWFVLGHFFHTKPLSLHDASHGTLDANRRKNTVMGLMCGTASLVPLSVYRHAHAYHHGYMSTEQDPELWPFNKPGTSRLFRMTCAFFEIFLGCIYTPLLFVRSLFTCGRLKKDLKRRILLEYGLVLLVWGSLFTVIGLNGWWMEFLMAFGVPYAIAGMYQTLNKYTEHMGLQGDTVLAGTRTVIPRTAVHKTVSNMMQHVDHHGTHHRFARIPFYALPRASEIVYGSPDDRNPVFSTYHEAFFDMIPTLWNPKVGSQWLEYERQNKGE